MSLQKKIWIACTFIAVIFGGVYISLKEDNQRLAKLHNQESTGQAAIGGDFTLTDHTGKIRTAKGFQGKYLMVYFGYTFCPDICPTGLQAMTEALDAIGPLKDKIQPLFITIDPERDTPKYMATYMESFHSKFLALTGTKAQVDQASKAYKVYASRVKDESSTDYLIDHSSIVYIMGPKGEYLGHFNHATLCKFF